ncbi:acetyl-CoA carboxylase, carboxyltransferase subunit beta [Candidatus Viridilinea mediisalina]|uniref:Acetyl-coenzyme A carboxylase carboxyl transferase subunit beta n=1 Tax=Candidatus Viridilinea mediisalina TaxID=2024553 RepID=A0A2A6RPE4_9CHLR|nr:acetyl-CoA carboxylase, carboxyltransferase subunit beta [Candidatus Viridilinea mediisalina]PDW04720.1 acetyl-CoA carboxylase, carboxyltransferase subunit beta [Candidatus Viridilinea mediisalina]
MKEFFRRTRKSFDSDQSAETVQIPDDLWVKCPSCRELIYRKELNDNLKVCPKCSHHMRMSAREWVGLLDVGSFSETDANLLPTDPLGFVTPDDTYANKLKKSQHRTGMTDAMLTGVGSINRMWIGIGVGDFSFMGASMGSVYGERLARAAEQAAKLNIPLLTINTSGGARQQEGVIALMQMAKVTMALSRLAEAGQPHIAVMIDPCYGGVTASYPSVADVIIAEPGANIGFAGKRLIEQIIRQKLPAGFQTAEFMLKNGMVDMVVSRSDLRDVLDRLLRHYNARSKPPVVQAQAEPELAGYAQGRA